MPASARCDSAVGTPIRFIAFADNSLRQRARLRAAANSSASLIPLPDESPSPVVYRWSTYGFIKGDLRDTAQLLQRCAAHQCAAPCRRRQPGGNGRGRGDHQMRTVSNRLLAASVFYKSTPKPPSNISGGISVTSSAMTINDGV